MPRYDEEYRGHSITVDTVKRGKGYGWTYQIDGGDLRESRDRPLDEQSMYMEALREAQAEIDRMDPPPKPRGT